MADKELRIRMILDKSQFDASAKAANKTLKETGDHLKDGTSAATSMKDAMLGMVTVQAGMAVVGQVVGSISSSMKEAADYTKRVAEQFVATRDAMREIAAIQGKGLTNEFAQSQIDIAKQAQILTPQETIGGIKAFQQYGSAYIGEQGQDQGSRISQGQLDELLPSVFSAAKVQGIEQGAAGQIFAKIVQAMPAHSKTSDYKDTFAKVLELAKNSSGSASLTANQLGPFLSANVGEGGAFAPTMEGIMSATKMISAVSEVNPQEAGPYTNQMVQDLNRIDIKGKDNDFGITDDMDPDQKVRAIAAKWKAETGGKNFKKWYSQKLGARMGNIQATTALSAIIMKGVEGGFFDAMEQKASKVSGDTLDKALAAHLETEGGRNDATEARTAIGAAERGIANTDVASMRAQARAELTEEGAFEQNHWLTSFRRNFPGGAGSTEDALINERALANAQAKANEAGIDAFTGPDSITGPLKGAFGHETEILAELKRIGELLRDANSQRSRAVPAIPPAIPGRPNAPGQMPR